ncbi:MAG: phage tail assembly protein [Bacillota bacterium]
MVLQTEFEFVLPKGYVDQEGSLHREGVMRLATAADEILPLKDPRVQQNPAYHTVILLSRVITRLGTLPAINTKTVEGLFASDLAYLQNLYNRINTDGNNMIKVSCPKCEHEFEAEPDRSGE